MKIKSNFLVISNFKNNLDWVTSYTDNYLIYNKLPDAPIPEIIDKSKIIQSEIYGYNSYDYFKYIIDHYDNLPDVVIFMKGHGFPRHYTQEYFDKNMNNTTYTPLMDETQHKPQLPISYIANGLYCELNNGWYRDMLPYKYFNTVNKFLQIIYENPPIPEYVAFAPGGDYIVPREVILRLPKSLYEYMKQAMGYHRTPLETHVIERCCNILWRSNWELNEVDRLTI